MISSQPRTPLLANTGLQYDGQSPATMTRPNDLPSIGNPPATSGMLSMNALRQKWLQSELLSLNSQLLKTKKNQGTLAVHQSRVSARKIRVLLHAWRSECHPVKYAELRFELRDLSRALQPGREADVRRQRIATILRHAPAALLQESRLQLAKLDQQRYLIRHQLRDTLHSPRWKRSLVLIAESLNSPELFALPNTTENLETESVVFNKQLDKLLKESARKKFAAQDLHDLRIKMKSMRYHGDALIDMQGLETPSGLKILHRLQSLLGDIHDDQQLSDWCRHADLNHSLRDFVLLTLKKSSTQLLAVFRIICSQQ